MTRRSLRMLYIVIIILFFVGYTNVDIAKMKQHLAGKRYTESVRIIRHDSVFRLIDSPVVIDEYIIIRENATLTVEPGTRVLFKKKIGIVCYGKIIANGTPLQKISFASEFGSGDSSWNNIILCGDSMGRSVFSHCIISGAGGIRYNDSFPPGIHPKDPEKFKSVNIDVKQVLLGGGAIICYKASPIITRCIFAKNSAPGHGGAVAISKGSSPRITKNLFVGNYALFNGGAIYSFNSLPIIEQNSFIQNRSIGKGGAVYLQDRENVSLKDNTFTGNSSRLGGAVFVIGDTLSLHNTLFYANHARAGGGVMAMNSTIEFVDSLFEGNTARFSGAGVYLSQSHAKFSGCRLNANVAKSGGMVFCVKSKLEDKGSRFLDNEPNNIEGCTSQAFTH